MLFEEWFFRGLKVRLFCSPHWSRPQNPRILIVRFDIQTAFRARMNIFQSGISGSVWEQPSATHPIFGNYRRLFGRHKLVTKDHSRARIHRFLMPHFGQKTGFRARMNEIKSGIPSVLWIIVSHYSRSIWSNLASLSNVWLKIDRGQLPCFNIMPWNVLSSPEKRRRMSLMKSSPTL